MNLPAQIPPSMGAWLDAAYPCFPYQSLGGSGAALFHDALLREQRSTVILPAFTSYTLSGAAVRANKRVLHVDADPDTLHMRPDQLEECIRRSGAEDTILLIDHTCGHPFPIITELRRRHPGLLIFEDCVRAVGGEAAGRPLGSEGDWALFSLYKTTPSNLDGAILLTNRSLEAAAEAPRPVSLKQLAAQFGALRNLKERVRGPRYEEPDRERGTLEWTPVRGAPNALSVRRFTSRLMGLGELCKRQRSAAERLGAFVEETPGLRLIRTAPDCTPAGHFLSFLVLGPLSRNRLLAGLHRQGCYLERTWHVVPAFYRGFAETFPHGSAGSVFLADHVAHIPLSEFLCPTRQERLMRAITRLTR